MGKKRAYQGIQTTSSGCDLNVVIPSPVNGGGSTTLNDLLERLSLLQYGTVALSRTIYGKPQNALKKKADNIDTVSLSKKYGLKVLKRCNIIVEESSDCVHYNGSTDSVLNDFDIIGLVARNAAVFSAVCSGAKGVDILVLDISKGKLPFWLTKQDLQVAADRGVVFELWYGPGLVDAAKRKFLIQTAVAFSQLARSIRPRLKLVISSGPRENGQDVDLGGLALRSISDLENIFCSVLHFEESVATAAMRGNAQCAINVGALRKRGFTNGVSNFIVQDNSNEYNQPIGFSDKKGLTLMPPIAKATANIDHIVSKTEMNNEGIEEVDVDDGFITF